MQRRPAVPVLRILRREARVLQQDAGNRQVPLDAGVVQRRAALGVGMELGGRNTAMNVWK